MKNLIVPLLAFAIFSFSSCAIVKDLGLKPTQLETVMALKDILNSSSFKALNTLKNVNDKGIEGTLPPEVGSVLNALRTIGYGNQIDQVKRSIGKASQLMLTESEGIMSDAIQELKFTDAVAVVLGGEDAATGVLKRAMYDTVKNRYSARLEQELGKTEVLDYWPLAANAYNLFAKNKIDNSLSDFLAERSVDALFLTMGKQEASIRTDYQSLGSSVVTKVFDYYVKNKQS